MYSVMESRALSKSLTTKQLKSYYWYIVESKDRYRVISRKIIYRHFKLVVMEAASVEGIRVSRALH